MFYRFLKKENVPYSIKHYVLSKKKKRKIHLEKLPTLKLF